MCFTDLVLEVDGCVEVRYLRIYRLADHFTLGRMEKSAHFCRYQHLICLFHSLRAHLAPAQAAHSFAGNLLDLAHHH